MKEFDNVEKNRCRRVRGGKESEVQKIPKK